MSQLYLACDIAEAEAFSTQAELWLTDPVLAFESTCSILNKSQREVSPESGTFISQRLSEETRVIQLNPLWIWTGLRIHSRFHSRCRTREPSPGIRPSRHELCTYGEEERGNCLIFTLISQEWKRYPWLLDEVNVKKMKCFLVFLNTIRTTLTS